MPKIGDIFVPDNLVPTATAPAAARPGIGAIFGGAVQQAYGQVRYGVPYAIEKQLGTANAGDEQFYQQGLARTSVAANAAPAASIDDLTSGRVGFARFVGENLAASAPQTLTTLAGGIIGARFGGVSGALAGSTAVGTPQFVGSNVGRAVQETGTLTEDAATRALLTAPLQAASDSLVERYLPGAEKFLGGFAAHQTGNFIARTAKSIAKAGATEAVTEAGQQLGERYAAGLDVTGPQAAAEYVNAAATAFAIGGVLGAGGGIRRTPAHVKAAAEVTTDDLNAAIDTGLAPKPAITPVTSPTYTPEVPGQSSVLPRLTDQRVQEPIVVGADGVAVTPDQRAAAASPDLLAPAAPVEGGAEARLADARALAAQAQAVGEEPARISQAVRDILAGRQQSSSIPEPLRASTPAFDPAAALQERLAQSQTSPLAIDATGEFNGTANLPEVRLFAKEPIADLHAALNAKTASPEVKAEATREVAQRIAEATGAAPLTTDNFQTRVDDVKQGLRGQFVQKLTATDPIDLKNKVYNEVFENQNTAKSVSTLAQRLGLLDENLEPTEAANAIEAQRVAAAQAEAATPVGTPVGTAPAAPAAAATTNEAPVAPAVPEAVSIAPATIDPEFGATWERLKKSAGISRLRSSAGIGTPANLQQAQASVFRALADDTVTRNGEASQVEKLAQKLGLITDDANMDVTPLGRKAFLATPEGAQEIASAAVQQGYAGPQAIVFTQGVQAATTGAEAAGHTSFEDLAAYEAGKVFAQDFIATPSTKTAAQTTAIQARQDTRATGKAVARENAQGTPLTPGQITQRGLNRLLDAADLRTASDSDVAALRKMVRDGASPEEVGAALQQVQGGKTLFRQPESTPRPLPSLPTRGQPIFKELNTAVDRNGSKAQQRAETEEAVRTVGQRQAIRQALLDGEISVARADKLNDMLDEGRVAAVEKVTANFGSIKRDANGRAAFGKNQFGYADPRLERELSGKTFTEAAQYMIDNAPSPYNKEVMTKVLALAKQIEATGGHSLELRIVRPGDSAPKIVGHPDLMAYTTVTNVPSRAIVWLKSAELSPEVGVNYQMAAHEMLHAVTMEALEYARESDPEGRTKLGRAARDLRDLSDAIQRHVNDRLDNLSSNTLNANSVDGTRKIEFELQHALGEHNAFADPHEILAWGLTNPDMQRYLQSIEYKPRQSVFARLVSLVRDLLGLGDAKYDTALTELMRVSEQVLGADARDLAPVFGRDDPDFGDERVLTAAAGAARTVTGTNETTKTVAETVSAAAEKLPLAEYKGKARRAALYVSSQNHIDQTYGHLMPGLLARSAAQRTNEAIKSRISAQAGQIHQSFQAYKTANPKLANALEGLMQATTEFQVDPTKPWEAHTHLDFSVDENGKIIPDKGKEADLVRLKKVYDQVVKVKNDLSRGDAAGFKIFTEARQHNEAQNFARMASELHALVALDPEFRLGVAGADVNPAAAFMTRGDLATTADVRSFWDTALNDQIKAAQAFIVQKKGEAAKGTESDVRAMNQHLSPIEAKIADIYEGLRGMARAPYFHLGRFGDNFGSAIIKTNEDGTVDTKAQRAVAEALDKAGFTGILISADNTRPKFSSRFETVDQANRFKALMLELHAQGYLTEDVNDIKTGAVDRDHDYGVGTNMPSYVQRYIQAIQDSPTFIPDENATAEERAALAKQKQHAVQLATDSWIESQGNNSITKVLTARYTVPGFSPDMMRSFAHRANVGAANIANIATRAQMADAYIDMRSQVQEARKAGNDQDPHLLADVLAEVRKRDAFNPINQEANSFQTLRQVSHAYFLGFSPAYSAIQLMQVGTNALPELAKKNGFGKSFHALRRSTPLALSVLKAAISEAQKGGFAHRADVVINDNVLMNAGLTQRQTEFLRHMLATGAIDIGATAHAIGTVARQGRYSKLDVATKYASAIGLYAETLSRLQVALAAHDLHGGDVQESAQYARGVVSEALFDYQSRNTGRAFGKQGFAGPITPLLAQFMTFSLQTTEKLYREAASAIGTPRPGESAEAAAERAAESRKFLAGHLTAITALAGTLGLPFASVFAAAAERLFSTKDEPFDATAAWRNFLASVLGKDVGEVVARGAPRALGFDISQRVGESDLLPFSQFLGDRRSWTESLSAAVGRSAGAAPDMLTGIADGGAQIANGDVLGGLKAVLPVAFKGPVEAYRLTAEGYVDTKGRKLPLTPGATDILYQLLGFTPEQRAEYSEARGDQQSRRLALTTQARNLTNRIVRSITNGDQQTAQELIARAQKFDEANPSFAVVPGLQSALQRTAQAQANARALGAPLGVSARDIAGRGLTSYANVDYR